MAEPSGDDVTQLLSNWASGDKTALDRIIPLVYRELHLRAQRYMARERSGHALQTTALVNEVYIRLLNFPQRNWENRIHFFAICAGLMRRILVDFARSQHYQKRGGGAVTVPLDEALTVSGETPLQIIAVDDALKSLAGFDARKSRVVELRFFGGLSVDETAEALKLSPETVMRDWKMAKVWLLKEIKGTKQRGT